MGRPRSPKHQQAQIVTFRRWLVERVAETAWVFNSTMTNQEMAERLGVQPDVLIDARRFLDAFYANRTKVLGLQPVRVARSNQVKVVSRRSYVMVRTPQVVFEEWCRYADERHLSRSDLLRSLLHLYLSQKDYPITSQDWTYKGIRYEAFVGLDVCPWTIQCSLPYEVKTLLSVRSKMIGIAMADIARALVLDLLHGKIHDLQLITRPAQLWSLDRYIRVDESVREATHQAIRWEDARAKARPRWAKQRAEKKKEKAHEKARADRSDRGHG
jgi:hypothetical protein